MKIYYDKYDRPEQPKVYICTPNNQPICALNGIDEDTFDLSLNLNNTYELSFDVNRFITIDDKEIESNGYSFLCTLMRIYVENIGYFIMKNPSQHGTGSREFKSVNAQSAEIEMQQHDIKLLKINKGTTDSYEMLVEGNVDKIGDVEFAKEQIKFCNRENTELSFLHILLKVTNTSKWTIGYIDDIPKTYRYYENGELKERQTKLSDEIGTFDVDSMDLYSFLTQEAAKFFSCIFVFDCMNFTINAYRPENLGKDTNITIGFRNLQQSNEITVDDNNFFTRVYVQGENELGINYVNFGDNYIENINHFLNKKYLNSELITKYKLWVDDVEFYRTTYIDNTKKYNEQQAIISELKNRVPLDDCSTDWSTFPDDKLLEAQANYQAQLKGYESFYVDDDGNFDEEALKKSPDADTYYQIRDVILPSIQIEIDNRNLPEGEENKDYIDSYKTDWKLYGLDELEFNLQTYKDNKKISEKEECTEPYDPETSKHTEDYHTIMYEKYIEAIKQLDPNFVGSCQEAYNLRKSEVDSATAIQDEHDKARKDVMKKIDKTTWTHQEADKNYSFTKLDLSDLSALYVDGDYTNSNMFLTNSDDAVTAIDEQLKLLDAATEDLDKISQPQYIYTTSLDNFLAKYEYKNYTDNLNIGDFIYLGVRDDYIVKLRVISINYNPLKMNNEIQITFSNMIKSRSGRDDFAFLLDSSGGSSKNSSIGGNGSDFLANEGVELTSGIIQQLLSSSALINKINQILNNGSISIPGGSISLGELNAKMIKVIDLFAENGFFEYLQAKLIEVDKIVAGSGDFKELNALVAMIDNLLAGNISSELGHIIHLTAESVSIDEAVIRDLIAAQITVSMLKAGDISADSFHIVSDDGGLAIVGNTMQFKDANGNIRIQIGRDKKNEFTFVLYDETGKGVLIDSTGIKESAIEDGLIKNDMIAPGTIEQDRLAFRVVETDENGKVDWGNITADGKGLDVEFGTIQESITKIENDIQNISNEKPITVQLDKEMYLIPCDKDGIVINNELIEIHFTVYKGVDKIPSTAQIDVLPSGMTLGKNEPSTTTSDGIIVFNVAQKAELNNVDSGSINIKFVHEKREITKSFSWVKLKESDGQQGDAARIFTLESDVSTVIKDEAEVFVPNKITFSSFYRDGKNTERFVYNGRFIIQESTNGVLFENKYLSNVDESSYTYTISNPDVKIIKCNLYASGSVTQLLDIKSVSILSDISQETIENINKQISSVSSKIDAVEKSITNKVWQSDITTQINNYDGTTVKTLRDQVAEQKIELGKISTKVSDVESTFSEGMQTLTEKVSEIEQDAEGFKQTVKKTYVSKSDKIGARNLLRNSKTLLFESYGFSNDSSVYLTDGGDYLVDENNNFLII